MHLGQRYAQLRRYLTATLCVLTSTLGVASTDIRVFTDRLHPIEAPSGVRIIELDAPSHIETELAANLPADPSRAAAIVRQRLNDGGADLQRRLADAYQGVTDAWSLGITRVPAVVVDQRYVVYGDTDVSRALARIERYRSKQP